MVSNFLLFSGFFVCDNCRHAGPWSILEKFLMPKKTGKIVKELATLKESLPVKEDFKNKWDELKIGCRSVSDLSNEEFHDMMRQLRILVRQISDYNRIVF